jgi:RND family efflux transporter MFP subunit
MNRIIRASGNSSLRVAAAIVLLPLVAAIGCNRAQSQDTAAKPPPPEVFFVLPQLRQVTDHEDFTGSTQAIKTVTIRARVSGYLDKVNFTEGALVKEGELLCEIDPRPYQAVYDSMVGQVHLNDAKLKEANADNSRAKGLASTPGAISLQDRDKFQAAEEQAMATLETSKANMATAELNLTYTKVLAPFSGRISRRLVDPGNLVVADTTPLSTIVTEGQIYANFFVDEHTLLRVRRLQAKDKAKSMQDTRQEVQLGLTDETDFPHKGTIDFEDNQTDQQTGTLQLRGIFPNTDRLLTPGLYVHIRLPIGQPHDALVVPEEALGTDQGQKFLYVIDDKNLAQHRSVTVGPEYGEGMRVVTEGLKPNERVVVIGLQRVFRPGQPVTPKPMPAKAEKDKVEQGEKVEQPKVEKAEQEKTAAPKTVAPVESKPAPAGRKDR